MNTRHSGTNNTVWTSEKGEDQEPFRTKRTRKSKNRGEHHKNQHCVTRQLPRAGVNVSGVSARRVGPGPAFQGRDIPRRCWTSVFLDSTHQMPTVPLPITEQPKLSPPFLQVSLWTKAFPSRTFVVLWHCLGPASEPRFVGLRSRATRVPFLCFSIDFPLPFCSPQGAGHPSKHPQFPVTPTKSREPRGGVAAGEDASARLHIILGNGLRLPQPSPTRPLVSISSHPTGNQGCRQAGAWEPKRVQTGLRGIAVPFSVRRCSKMTRASGYPQPGTQ